MNEKERLVDIIRNISIGGIPFKARFYKSTIEKIADYLLENGVIVPPVKVGTKVYTIICGQIYEYEIASYTVDGDGFSFIHLAYMTGNTMHGTTHTIEEFKRQYYLTKEEAEKHLKGGTINE